MPTCIQRQLPFLCLIVILTVGGSHSAESVAKDLVIVTRGGQTEVAVKSAFALPFSAATDTNVKFDSWAGEMAKIRGQVETSQASWDLVHVESAELELGCTEGLFVRLPWSEFANRGDLVETNPCGMVLLEAGVVLVYDGNKISEQNAPSSWADFWDVKRWPGARGLRIGPKYCLEIALMAEGVPANQVYKVLSSPGGVDRAFRKLDELKPYIKWWRSGANFVQMLGSGEVIMAWGGSGRAAAANTVDKRNFKLVWRAGAIVTPDYLAIVKGAPHEKEALAFLHFMTNPKLQADFTKYIPYGPASKQAYTLISPDLLPYLTSGAAARGFTAPEDVAFWATNLDKLTAQFNAWVAR